MLFVLVIWCGYDATLPCYGSGQGHAHSGISRGAFNDGSAWFQLSRLLSVIDHLQCHAVLDGISRVEGFKLGQNQSWYFLSKPVYLNQRGVSNGDRKSTRLNSSH